MTPSKEEQVAFYKRCQAFIYKRTSVQEFQQDFPSWAVVYFMRGRKATPEQLFVDYLRETYGKNGNKGALRNASFTTEEVSETLFGSEVQPECQFLQESLLARLTGIDRIMFYLRYKWDMLEREIGECFGITDSAVSLRMSRVFQKLKKHVKEESTLDLPYCDMEQMVKREPIVVSPKLQDVYNKVTDYLKSHPGTSAIEATRVLGLNVTYFYNARGVIEGRNSNNRRRTTQPMQLTVPEEIRAGAERRPVQQTPVQDRELNVLNVTVTALRSLSTEERYRVVAAMVILLNMPPMDANDSPHLLELRSVIDQQKADEGLWPKAETAPEQYQQDGLRRLHECCTRLLDGL